MYERFWKAALAVGGLGAIGAFVFWSLYKDWLQLDIFSKMSSDQTFIVMLVFLALVFGALIVIAILYVSKGRVEGGLPDHVFKLHDAWEGVNDLDCDSLIGPDVTKAARAMSITASSWLNGLVEKRIIFQSHFEDYEMLYKVLVSCDRLVPGFEKRGLKCKDFLTSEMTTTYEQMLSYKLGGKL